MRKILIVLLLFAKGNAQNYTAMADSVAAKLRTDYYDEAVGGKIADQMQQFRTAGAYDTITSLRSFIKTLNTDLRRASIDKHLYAHSATTQNKRQPEVENRNLDYGITASVLPSGAGYLKISSFNDDSTAAKKALRSAFEKLVHCSSLVIDLRENMGGEPEMVRYACGFLLAKQTHINDMCEPRSGKCEHYTSIPESGLDSLFTMPLSILVSSRTFSAAEEFAYDLQILKRATIIGEPTAGGAHPVKQFRIGQIVISIPYQEVINPVTGSSWEGAGVIPDVLLAAVKPVP